MIQRIQSFYLILAACAMALCFVFPLVTSNAKNADTGVEVLSQLNLMPQGDAQDNALEQAAQGSQSIVIQQTLNTWPLMILAAVCVLIAVVSIFLYKNRTRQVRVVATGFLLNVVFLFLLFIWAMDKYQDYFVQMATALGCGNTTPHLSVGAWSSVISLVLFFLAQRAIKKDEAKVRAADRLR